MVINKLSAISWTPKYLLSATKTQLYADGRREHRFSLFARFVVGDIPVWCFSTESNFVGKTVVSDILSLSNTDTGLFTFGFSAHYGYGGNMLDLLERYEQAGDTKHSIAIIKSLTKSKLRWVRVLYNTF